MVVQVDVIVAVMVVKLLVIVNVKLVLTVLDVLVVKDVLDVHSWCSWFTGNSGSCRAGNGKQCTNWA